jgi:cytochrome b561
MTPKTYSKTQVTLHWTVVVLVLFQVFLHDDIVRIWTGRMDGTLPNEVTPNLHAAVGLLIFALVVWRLVLRLRRGVPAPPATEHPALRLVASATHILFYVLLLGMPISGSVAWFLGKDVAAQAHSLAGKILVALVLLHALAALVQHFWFKTDVLKRMLGRT